MLPALLQARGHAAEGAEQCATLDSTWAALLVLSQCRLPAREQEAIARAAAEQARAFSPLQKRACVLPQPGTAMGIVELGSKGPKSWTVALIF